MLNSPTNSGAPHAQPLHLVVVADLHSGLPESAPAVISSVADLSQLLRQHSPKLEFNVSDGLGSGTGTVRVDLTISDIDALSPRGIVAQCPALGSVGASGTPALARQIDAILHHPDFQRTEAVWRGLRFLVERIDFARGAQLTVLNASRANLASRMDKELVSQPPTDPRPTLLLAPYGFDDPVDDVATVDALGQAAALLQAPLVFSLGPGFLGLDCGASAAGLRDVNAILDQPRYDGWRTLQLRPSARWLAGAFNGFLLRAPWKTQPSGIAGYEESIGHCNDRPWGDPSFIVGSLVAKSWSTTGWPTEILGTRCWVDGLPLQELCTDCGAVRIPLQAPIRARVAGELARAGAVALCCRDDVDEAFAMALPTMFRPADGIPEGADLELPNQLLISRVLAAVDRYRASVPNGASASEIERGLAQQLRQLVEGTGPAASVTLRAEPSGPSGAVEMSLQVRTGTTVLGGASVGLILDLVGDEESG